ncbi:MAG: CDP-alcohol phosphatidyltransferase family protein [Polyangiaceae bacterium]
MSSAFDVAPESRAQAGVQVAVEEEGFWAAYKKSLKPLDVEEPIDVWVHRPLAYVLSKVLYPTPVSPNLVTLISIVFGVTGGVLLVTSSPWHMQLGALCIFLSAIFDCADGQLARMRGTSSALGRMLDGAADLVVSVATVGGGAFVVWSKFNDTWWTGAIALALCLATAVTGSYHTSTYDHYKNVFLRLTSPRFREGEDYETARARFDEKRAEGGLLVRLAWYPYLFYVRSQATYVLGFDPHTSAMFSRYPEFSEANATIYRKHALAPMKVFKACFGFGSLVFGLTVFAALDLVEVYMVLRLVLQNAIFYGYLRPLQRRASKAAFEEMGVHLPDQAPAAA